VASSAGGINALGHLLAGLPADLAVPVVIVQHLDPRHRTIIADVLARRSHLPVRLATPGVRPQPGTAYIAPPDHHLTVGAGGLFSLSSGGPVHFVRPAADVLFESVARRCGKRAIACVLTGSGRDGATGVTAVKSHGGTVIVQDPATAEFSSMPEAAVATGVADFILPLDEIASVVKGLVETRNE